MAAGKREREEGREGEWMRGRREEGGGGRKGGREEGGGRREEGGRGEGEREGGLKGVYICSIVKGSQDLMTMTCWTRANW